MNIIVSTASREKLNSINPRAPHDPTSFFSFIVKDVLTGALYYLSNQKECDVFFDEYDRPYDLKLLTRMEVAN